MSGASSNELYGKRSKRGKAKGLKSLRKPETEDVTEVFWSEMPVELVAWMIEWVTRAGGAVMLSRSRKGDVLGVRVYHDEYKAETIWFHSKEEGYDVMTAIAVEFGATEA